METVSSTHQTSLEEKRSGGLYHLLRDVSAFGLIAVASLGIGLLINKTRVRPLPLEYASPKKRLDQVVTRMSVGTAVNPSPAPALRRWQNMGLDELQDLVTARRGLIIDARPKSFYQAGHVPGALSLPREDFEKGYPAIRPRLEAAKRNPLVIYCSEADCKDSELVAEALSRLEYQQLFVYKEGWEEWSRAGLPQEAGPGL